MQKQDSAPGEQFHDVAVVLTEQRNAALNQVAEFAVQIRKSQRRVAELERRLVESAKSKATKRKKDD